LANFSLVYSPLILHPDLYFLTATASFRISD
jgi:hypothetical protein